jgi:hypothetical protein
MIYILSMGRYWVHPALRRFPLSVLALQSHDLAVLCRLVPVTSTATYLPRWADVSL